MEKIVITGGLGYIGTELCKIYSGESRYKDIYVLDNRFVSERVKQLADWGMNFIHGSILDEKLVCIGNGIITSFSFFKNLNIINNL